MPTTFDPGLRFDLTMLRNIIDTIERRALQGLEVPVEVVSQATSAILLSMSSLDFNESGGVLAFVSTATKLEIDDAFRPATAAWDAENDFDEDEDADEIPVNMARKQITSQHPALDRVAAMFAGVGRPVRLVDCTPK